MVPRLGDRPDAARRVRRSREGKRARGCGRESPKFLWRLRGVKIRRMCFSLRNYSLNLDHAQTVIFLDEGLPGGASEPPGASIQV